MESLKTSQISCRKYSLSQLKYTFELKVYLSFLLRLHLQDTL